MFIRFNSDSSTSGNGVRMTWSDAVLTSAPSKRCILTKEMVGSYPPCSECASQAQARPQKHCLARSSTLRETSCQHGGVRVAGAGKWRASQNFGAASRLGDLPAVRWTDSWRRRWISS
jgi:hypothetical protein